MPRRKDERKRVLGVYDRGEKYSSDRYRIIIVEPGNGKPLTRDYSTPGQAETAKRIVEDEWTKQEVEAKTVNEAIDAYDLHLKEKGTGDISRVETIRRLRLFFAPVLDVQVRYVTASRAAQLYVTRDAGGAIVGGFVVGHSVDYHRNALLEVQTFGRWWRERGWVKESPFAGVKGIGKRKTGKPQLTGDEAHRFLFAALWMGYALDDLGAFVCGLKLALALRQKDLIRRVVRDLDLSGTQLRIENGKSKKSNRPRKVPFIFQQLLRQVAAGRSALAPLFEARTGGFHTNTWLRKAAKRVCAAAGVPYVPPHGLKGTAGSVLAEDGELADRIMLHLSHEKRSTTERHYVDADVIEAAQAQRGLAVIQGGKR